MLMCELMGVLEYQQISIRTFDEPEEFERFVVDQPQWKGALREYRRDGYPMGCARTELEYGRHTILIFSWLFTDYHQLNEVLLHEVAHLATHDTHLLAGPPQVRTFVNERIIMPMLRAVYYDPLQKLLQPRRIQASNPDNVSVPFPGTPQRLT